jgi:excisionase family DNA binding protein
MAESSTSEPGPGGARRFLTLADVAEILATSVAQVRSLVQSGDLRYIQIGGRQQYRIEAVELENYIQRMYDRVEGREPSSGQDADTRSGRPT